MGTEIIPETPENLHGFGATKPPTHPEDGDRVSSRNVGKPSYFCATKPSAHPEDGDGIISRSVGKPL
jgi:hypothetical protein